MKMHRFVNVNYWKVQYINKTMQVWPRTEKLASKDILLTKSISKIFIFSKFLTKCMVKNTFYSESRQNNSFHFVTNWKILKLLVISFIIKLYVRIENFCNRLKLFQVLFIVKLFVCIKFVYHGLVIWWL